MEQIEIDAKIEAAGAEQEVLLAFSDRDEVESYFGEAKAKVNNCHSWCKAQEIHNITEK